MGKKREEELKEAEERARKNIDDRRKEQGGHQCKHSKKTI